ncbi:MAG: omptin family outer membrane protease [Desulfobulbaceae bacterium]|nr:omptin family outer membrane protease [Desulfobulbaceae bacterium]
MFTKKIAVAVLAAISGLSSAAMVSAADRADNSGQNSVSAGALEFSMDAGVETWGGDITYQIGFPVTDAYGNTYHGYFPFSELSFPLDATFGVVEAEAVIIDKYAVGLKVKKNVTDPDDPLEDRDWITPSDTHRLDIYSESEVTDFSALVIDVDVSYRFFHNDRAMLAAGVGYMYQDFEYETSVRRQWSPSGYTGYDYVGDGSTSLIYEVDFEMPYFLVEGQFNIIPALKINGRFAFAPWVDVDDRDQHLLRNKVNTGDLSGSAVMAAVGVEYDFTPWMFVTGGLEHTYVDVDGDMDASFYGIYDHTVAEELESSQTSLFAKIGFRFGVPAAR